MIRSLWLSFPLVILCLASCSDASNGPSDPAAPRHDVSMGRAAFVQDCSTCHASGDGFDLRTFSFSDTTIIRRAVNHVDTATRSEERRVGKESVSRWPPCGDAIEQVAC